VDTKPAKMNNDEQCISQTCGLAITSAAAQAAPREWPISTRPRSLRVHCHWVRASSLHTQCCGQFCQAASHTGLLEVTYLPWPSVCPRVLLLVLLLPSAESSASMTARPNRPLHSRVYADAWVTLQHTEANNGVISLSSCA
jgi:hypothetical protein